jgi:hypothetical protein
MAEIKQIQRGSFEVTPGSWPGGSGGVLNVGQLEPTPNVGPTILRSVSFPSVHVAVGSPGTGTPPEGWWWRATFNWFIWASESSSTSPPIYGEDSGCLFLGRLIPRLVASPSVPDSYYVTFEGPATGFESKGQRHASGGNPIYMNTGLRWEDPLGGLDEAVFPSSSVSVRSVDICVFGVSP